MKGNIIGAIAEYNRYLRGKNGLPSGIYHELGTLHFSAETFFKEYLLEQEKCINDLSPRVQRMSALSKVCEEYRLHRKKGFL